MQQLGIEKYYLHQGLTGICYQRLLPLCDGAAVLFDVLSGKELSTVIEEQKMQGMSNAWRQQLKKLREEGRITVANYEKLKNG